MKVIWTPKAASGLKQAVGYIAEDKTDAAGHLSARIYQSVMKLESTPYNGR
jgi:plasmid stabilization system protein ParE